MKSEKASNISDYEELVLTFLYVLFGHLQVRTNILYHSAKARSMDITKFPIK
jgi:hypothetical protein